MHETLANYYRDQGDFQTASHHEEEVNRIVTGIAAGLEDAALKTSLPLTP